MKKYLILQILVSLLLATYSLAGPTAKPTFLSDIRCLAMGGTGVASARGSFGYIYNPALLTREKFTLTLPGVQCELGKDFFDIINYATDNRDKFKKLDKDSVNVTQEEKDQILHELKMDAAQFDNIWYKASLIPYLGMVVGNIGISMYNITYFAAKLDVGIIAPKVKFYALNDLVFSCGYGHQVNESLALGIGAKLIRRFESSVFKLQVEEASGMKEALREGIDEMEKGKNGYGIDIGALYNLNQRLDLAVVAQDLLGEIGGINTPMNIKLGLVYQLNRLVLAADLEDLFNRDGDKFINKVYLGGEYALPIISLRFGFSQGYPAVGIGLNFWILDLAYTYYTKEITDSPGLRGENYHLFGLRMGWQ
ncbi:MAG: hypothetical protein ONB05_04815 [candidate division KSB1 bacterium]|nr:hypothetical protein [candidate division KSB1 bacterium]